jgi:hypothetical protein
MGMINKNFAVFIMVHGRPEGMKTYDTLRRQGYTGQIYLVADNLDDTRSDYIKLYGDQVIVFDKLEAAKRVDSGDNTGDLRSTLFASNIIYDLATDLGITHFFIMCDDYQNLFYAMSDSTGSVYIKNLDRTFDYMVEYYKSSPIAILAFAQTGDFIGGVENKKGAYRFSKRKAMNTLLCSTERRVEFLGRLNDDVTTYVRQGSVGDLFITIPVVSLSQPDTQKRRKGLTDVYQDTGTYVKSFFSVMYSPSAVKISMMGDNHMRIHHRITWNNAVPKIIDEKYKK